MSRAKALAWGIHLYTMSGGVVGLFALYAAAQGRIRETFLLLVLAALIDGTDGILARRARVHDHLPHFDGAMVDNVIDFLTYIWIPVFIIGSQNLLPHLAWTIFPTLAALYAYGQTNMKTDDGFFVGFPSLWNGIALYLWWLKPVDWLAVLLVLIPSALSFVPTRYLYPSKGMAFWRVGLYGGMAWGLLLFVLLLQDGPPVELILLSATYPVWYLAASFYTEFRLRRA
jgi:phosphatidylcholine synthase